MLTKSRKSLSLSGGGLVSNDQSLKSLMANSYTSYSPNAPNGEQFGEWEENIDINTPDINPHFFTDDNLFKKTNNQMDDYLDEDLIIGDEQHFINFNVNDETSHTLTLEENNFIDLSQLITQSSAESEPNRESMVSPNEVLNNTYIPSTTVPVFHYLQPNTVESIVPSVSIPVITTINTSIDSITCHTYEDSHQSLSSPLMTSPSSPTLSYTSTSSNSYCVPSEEAMNTDSNTIDSMFERKPQLAFLQPTVINDHLYTRPLTSLRKSSKDSHKDIKYMTIRKKNNMASKKSRITKRDKQKQMDELIEHYTKDNKKCYEDIDRMEKEIEWCKNYLFKKVRAGSKS